MSGAKAEVVRPGNVAGISLPQSVYSGIISLFQPDFEKIIR